MTPEPWRQLQAARAAYGALHRAMFDAGVWEVQMRRALRAPRGRATALRTLRNTTTQQVMDLADDVFGAAVAAEQPAPELGRQVLARLDPGWLAGRLGPLIDRWWDEGPSADEVLRAGELLTALGQPAALDRLARRAESAQLRWAGRRQPVDGRDQGLAMMETIEKPVATARLRWLTVDRGGRRSGPPTAAVYAATCVLPLGGEEEFQPGQPATAEKLSILLQEVESGFPDEHRYWVGFLAPELARSFLRPGARLLITEGPKVVASGHIEDVFLGE